MTPQIVNSFKDTRVQYHRFDKNTGNIAAIRNKAFNLVKSDWVFITDSDCHAHRDWLKEGVKAIQKQPDVAGIEGQLIYGSEGYKKTLSDRYIENRKGGRFCMANAAYKRKVLLTYPMDEESNRQQDRRVALSMLRDGYRIMFVEKSKVYHVIKKDSIKWILFGAPKTAIGHIKLYKEFNDNSTVKNRIFYPEGLLKIIFPPLMLYSLIFKVRTRSDLLKWVLSYPQLLIQRYWVWHTALKERIFIL